MDNKTEVTGVISGRFAGTVSSIEEQEDKPTLHLVDVKGKEWGIWRDEKGTQSTPMIRPDLSVKAQNVLNCLGHVQHLDMACGRLHKLFGDVVLGKFQVMEVKESMDYSKEFPISPVMTIEQTMVWVEGYTRGIVDGKKFMSESQQAKAIVGKV